MTAPLEAPELDVTAALPDGTTLVEASAGTGKTWAIAGLVTRALADGAVTADQLLVMTFTRAATSELRERVRSRLRDTADHLDAVAAGAHPDPGDPVATALAAGDPAALAARRRRLGRALAELDTATITTIHGFCQQALAVVGVAGDLDGRAALLEDQQQLVAEVLDDFLVRGFHDADDQRLACLPRRGDLLDLAGPVLGNPDAGIRPRWGMDSVAEVRAAMAHRLRTEIDLRKRRQGVLAFEDLITRLAATVDPDRGDPRARDALRRRYRLVLVDEFQDTDPTQWRILEHLFHGVCPLLLVGDPKQAIYAFRGGDVHASLAAGERAHHRRTLATNHRSDGRFVAACSRLFGGVRFGHDAITFRDVAAAHPADRLTGPDLVGIELRVVRKADHPTAPRSRYGDLGRSWTQELVAADTAHVIAGLLRDGTEVQGRPCQARDLAVLVRTNAEADLVAATLGAAGIPAVLGGVGDVLSTPAATHWLRLLEAVEQPSSSGRARLLALTPLLGWTAEQVATADDLQWADLHTTLQDWARTARASGIAALFRRVAATTGLQARVLGTPGGQRLLADLEHLRDLLHATATAEGLGPAALAGWLAAGIAGATDLPADPTARRLESDADAVRVLTVHRSKGLQFPIVLAPYLWTPPRALWATAVFHDDDGRRWIDVGGTRQDDDWRHAKEQATHEQLGEELRLAYVAVTRAVHRAYVWWAPADGACFSGLAALLFRNGQDRGQVQPRKLPGERLAEELIAELLGPDGGRAPSGDGSLLRAVPVPPRPALPEPAAPTPPPSLATATFTRTIDHTWRRGSYSALVAGPTGTGPAWPQEGVEEVESGRRIVDDEPTVTLEGDDAAGDDAAPGVTLPVGAAADPLAVHRPDLEPDDPLAVPVPLGTIPAGAEVGTALHAVLEEVDFTAADLPAAVRDQVREQSERHRLDLGDEDVVVDGLVAAVRTPLGPLVGDVALADVARPDRLDEIAFEFAVGGRDGQVVVAQLRDLLRHHLGPDDSLAAYPDALTGPLAERALRGYLAGRIDLVVRVGGDRPRYAVADHKSNLLAMPGTPVLAWHYTPERMVAAMTEHHYPLQALLYLTAVHRYLRWRLPGYDPDHDLAGVLYLFFRGMLGPDTPRVGGQPCGVFAWRPPTALLDDLDLLFATGRMAA